MECDSAIFQNGKVIALLDTKSNHAEEWVKAVAASARSRLDWHRCGGYARVLHLGDAASWRRSNAAITRLAGSLKGSIKERVHGYQ